jgi:hypothetical protein
MKKLLLIGLLATAAVMQPVKITAEQPDMLIFGLSVAAAAMGQFISNAAAMEQFISNVDSEKREATKKSINDLLSIIQKNWGKKVIYKWLPAMLSECSGSNEAGKIVAEKIHQMQLKNAFSNEQQQHTWVDICNELEALCSTLKTQFQGEAWISTDMMGGEELRNMRRADITNAVEEFCEFLLNNRSLVEAAVSALEKRMEADAPHQSSTPVKVVIEGLRQTEDWIKKELSL